MCDPISITVASLAFSTASQIGAAKAQNKASAANRAEAVRAFKEANRDISLLQSQEKRAHAANVFDIERTARSAQAVAAVSAGEAGVTGQSVRDILNDLDREKGEATSREEANLDDRMAMLEREKIAGRSALRQRIASVPRASTFGTILGIGTSVIGAAGTFNELRRGTDA